MIHWKVHPKASFDKLTLFCILTANKSSEFTALCEFFLARAFVGMIH